MLAVKGWLLTSASYSSSSTWGGKNPLLANRTVNSRSTGQSSFGVNCSSLSSIQNHVPAIVGDRSTPVVTTFCSDFNGAADSLNRIFSGLIEEMPLSLYSVRPGALTT